MNRPLILDDFGNPGSVGIAADTGPSGTEDTLASYEEGYKAGWDDAVEANNQSNHQISADFAKSLQDIDFTYQEARTQVLQSLAPLLELMATQVLPEIAQHGFANTVLEQVQAAADAISDEPVEVVINPENRPALENLIDTTSGPEIQLVEEASLGPGQAYIRFGGQETQLDLESVTSGIQTAVQAFLSTETHPKVHHGSQ